MCEPWCWRPWEVDRLTDAEVARIIRGQAERVKGSKPETKAASSPPGPVRSGAAYSYLISTGMTPEQAERALRR